MKPYYEVDGVVIYHGDCLSAEAQRALMELAWAVAWIEENGAYVIRHGGVANMPYGWMVSLPSVEGYGPSLVAATKSLKAKIEQDKTRAL